MAHEGLLGTTYNIVKYTACAAVIAVAGCSQKQPSKLEESLKEPIPARSKLDLEGIAGIKEIPLSGGGVYLSEEETIQKYERMDNFDIYIIRTESDENKRSLIVIDRDSYVTFLYNDGDKKTWTNPGLMYLLSPSSKQLEAIRKAIKLSGKKIPLIKPSK